MFIVHPKVGAFHYFSLQVWVSTSLHLKLQIVSHQNRMCLAQNQGKGDCIWISLRCKKPGRSLKNVKPSLCFCRLSLSVSLGFLLISFGSFHVYLALLLAFFVFDCFFFGSPVTGPRKLQKGKLECHKSVLLSASRPQSHPQVNPHSRRATFPCGLSITPPALPNSAGNHIPLRLPSQLSGNPGKVFVQEPLVFLISRDWAQLGNKYIC